MGPILELIGLQLERERGHKCFTYWAQDRAMADQLIASRWSARLARIAAAVIKYIVLFVLISYSTVEEGEDNWCYHRKAPDPFGSGPPFIR